MHNISRKHHYIPQFYLAGFTPSGSKKDRLWVTDEQTGNQWQSLPESIAFQRDLYSLEKDLSCETDYNEDEIEKVFSTLESMASQVIRNIIETHTIPSGEDFNILMNFIALLASRTPSMIEHRTKPLIEMNEIIMDMYLSSKERWDSLTRRMVAAGKFNESILADDGYIKMKDFFYNKRYTMKIPQNYKIKQLFDSIDILLPLLAQREWSLLVSSDVTTTFPQLGGFICSDNPVALVSMDDLPPAYSPGFGMLRTEVTLPLSKNVALVGRFEGKSTVTTISIKGMAAINSRTCMYLDRFMYHPNKNFIYIKKDGTIGNATSLISEIKQSSIS